MSSSSRPQHLHLDSIFVLHFYVGGTSSSLCFFVFARFKLLTVFKLFTSLGTVPILFHSSTTRLHNIKREKTFIFMQRGGRSVEPEVPGGPHLLLGIHPPQRSLQLPHKLAKGDEINPGVRIRAGIFKETVEARNRGGIGL